MLLAKLPIDEQEKLLVQLQDAVLASCSNKPCVILAIRYDGSCPGLDACVLKYYIVIQEAPVT